MRKPWIAGTPLEAWRPPEFRLEALKEPSGWLLTGILPISGTAIVAGTPIAGKTRFLAALSVCCASGTPFCGRDVHQGGVLWIHLEHKKQNLLAHLDAASAGLGVPWEGLPIHFLNTDLYAWQMGDSYLEALAVLADQLGVSVIILDSLRRAGDHKEAASEDVAILMARLTLLTAGNTRLVIGIHHTTKSGKTIRGSGDFEGASDSTVILSREDDPSDETPTTLSPRHHNAANEEWTFQVEHRDGWLSYTVDDAQKEPATQRKTPKPRSPEDVILGLLSKEPLSRRALREAVRDSGIKRRDDFLDSVIDRMLDGGLLSESDGPNRSRIVSKSDRF